MTNKILIQLNYGSSGNPSDGYPSVYSSNTELSSSSSDSQRNKKSNNSGCLSVILLFTLIAILIIFY